MALTQVQTGMVADAAITPVKMQNGGAEFGMTNRIINGRMEFSQRASSFTNPNNTYTLDRWNVTNDVSGMVVSQSSNAPTGYLNSLLWTNGTGSTPGVGNTCTLGQGIEGFNTTDLAFGTASAQAVSLIFWVKSSIAGQRSVTLNNASTSPFTTFTRSYIANYTINSANTWEQKVINIPGDTAGSWMVGTNGCAMAVLFDAHSGTNYNGTAGVWGSTQVWRTSGDANFHGTTSATMQWTGVELRKGTYTAAPSIDYRPYTTEQQLCYRYYFQDSGGGGSVGYMYHASTGDPNVHCIYSYKVTMRAIPTITITVSNTTAGTQYVGVNSCELFATSPGTGGESRVNSMIISAEL